MSDEQTPDVPADAEVDPIPDTLDTPGADAPAPEGTAKGRRGRSRVGTPAPAAKATPAPEDAEASPDEGETTSGAAAEAVVEASTSDGINGELKDPELFDPAEVANAPRAPHPLKPVVEALIFASPEPLTVKAMGRLLEEHAKEEIEAALAEVRETYLKSDGLQLVEVAGGFQIVTRPELYEWVRRLFKERTTSKLSVQALETLAVIAYKQPVTSGEIAEIRGVSATTGVLNTLLDRKLVKIVGRKQVVGRPFMYGTTREFLDKFGLRDLSDLPKVEDMSEALGFDLPSPVDEDDGVSLPFDDAGPVEPLLFEESELQPIQTAAPAEPAASSAGAEEDFVAVGPEAELDDSVSVLDADAPSDEEH